MLDIAYSKNALADLKKIPVNESRRIRAKVADYALNPPSHAHQVKNLKGREGYRLRVGNWRVLFDVNGNVMAILRVGARGNVYD